MADLSKEKSLDPFSLWAFIRFISIGMQIKLINHCQPEGLNNTAFTENFEGLF